MSTAPKRPPGRPRKWASEGDRKRAYRRRKAEELADPLAARASAQAARNRANDAEQDAARARSQMERYKARLAAAEQRAEKARERAAVAEKAAQRARAGCDQARRLLEAKWRAGGTGRQLMKDPERLVAAMADLRTDYDSLRRELLFARQALGYRSDKPLPGGNGSNSRW